MNCWLPPRVASAVRKGCLEPRWGAVARPQACKPLRILESRRMIRSWLGKRWEREKEGNRMEGRESISWVWGHCIGTWIFWDHEVREGSGRWWGEVWDYGGSTWCVTFILCGRVEGHDQIWGLEWSLWWLSWTRVGGGSAWRQRRSGGKDQGPPFSGRRGVAWGNFALGIQTSLLSIDSTNIDHWLYVSPPKSFQGVGRHICR